MALSSFSDAVLISLIVAKFHHKSFQSWQQENAACGQVRWMRWLRHDCDAILANKLGTSKMTSALSSCNIHNTIPVVCFLLRQVNGALLQGNVPYWPYRLLARTHYAPRQCNRRKPPAKHSHMTELGVPSRSWLLSMLSWEWLDFGFNVIIIYLCFVTSYDSVEQISIVVNVIQQLLSDATILSVTI